MLTERLAGAVVGVCLCGRAAPQQGTLLCGRHIRGVGVAGKDGGHSTTTTHLQLLNGIRGKGRRGGQGVVRPVAVGLGNQKKGCVFVHVMGGFAASAACNFWRTAVGYYAAVCSLVGLPYQAGYQLVAQNVSCR